MCNWQVAGSDTACILDTGMSTVTRCDPAAPAGSRLTFPVPDVGFVVVGASVSTCAPPVIE